MHADSIACGFDVHSGSDPIEPGEPVFDALVRRGRKQLRPVECADVEVDHAGQVVVAVVERRAAHRAETAPCARRRLEFGGRQATEFHLRDRIVDIDSEWRAGLAPAIAAMAGRDAFGRALRNEGHRLAKA